MRISWATVAVMCLVAILLLAVCGVDIYSIATSPNPYSDPREFAAWENRRWGLIQIEAMLGLVSLVVAAIIAGALTEGIVRLVRWLRSRRGEEQ
jgi:hypothetical protein